MGARDEVNGYPVQAAKVQRPPLREQTLSRDRLLDWLNVKVNSRVVFVTAEAGYGKTTLLADFSRKTRRRTLWYRLDEDDRHWIAFLNYLVAAGREQDPGFAPMTASLLRETSTGGPSADSIIQTFVREFQDLGDDGAVLILDDYHVVDDAPDVRQIMAELLARAPERVCFVFLSRRQPSVRVARLRALGEVSELITDDLRFSEAETGRLFREAYGQPLEPDVLGDLSRRTEGWAASLQLVSTAIRERSPAQVRSFVRSMSGAEGDLYDYFAEEVVGDLEPGLQDFLIRISILDTVEPEMSAVITGASNEEAKERIEAAERLGLLSRHGERNRFVQRFHPLVRQFLEHRIERSIGKRGVHALHLAVADHARSIGDWRLAAVHYSAASEEGQLHAVLSSSLQSIMGTGQYAIAAGFLEQHPPAVSNPSFDIIRSRVAFRRGDVAGALEYAGRAAEAVPDSDSALVNLASLNQMSGHLSSAIENASILASRTADPIHRALARATLHTLRASLDGSLTETADELASLATVLGRAGFIHYQGVCLLNGSVMLRAVGDAPRALEMASDAAELLGSSSGGEEVIAARLVRAWALAHLNEWEPALTELADLKPATIASRVEVLTESALIFTLYGDPRMATPMLDEAQSLVAEAPAIREMLALVAARHAIRLGETTRAASILDAIDPEAPTPEPAHHLHRLLVTAILKVATQVDPSADLATATKLARRQGSDLFIEQCRLLSALWSDSVRFNEHTSGTLRRAPVYVSMLSDLVGARLHDLDDPTVAAITEEASARAATWRHALRGVVDDQRSPARPVAAHILDWVGDREDIARLRALAKSGRQDDSLGKGLARRLAPRVMLEDQGRVSIVVGDERVVGTSIRRKVLAALMFLASRPGFSATRDQILDALWPDLSPEVAMNSLNQTIYFLRRVFEPKYKEELSPEYIHHDSDVIWLDPTLVESRSAQCWLLIGKLPEAPAPGQIDALSRLYEGRFALDFAYEEWAVAFRENLHAAYLQVIEHAVIADTATGHFERGVRLARRALEIDPEAEQLELSLLRLYRQSGAHSAAAEQYAHYAELLRTELGIEPPPLSSL